MEKLVQVRWYFELGMIYVLFLLMEYFVSPNLHVLSIFSVYKLFGEELVYVSIAGDFFHVDTDELGAS